MFILSSLRARVLLAALIPSALSLAAVAVIALYVYERVARDVVQQRDTELARVSAERLAEGPDRHQLNLQLTAADEDVRSMDPSRAGQALRSAADRLFVFDAGVAVYNHEGAPVTSHLYEGEFPVPSEFAKVRETRRGSISNIVYDPLSGEDVFLMTVPIVGSGTEFRGVLAGLATVRRSRLGAMYVKVLEFKPGKKGFAYLVDGNGRVIHHRHTFQLGKSLAGAEPVAQVIQGDSGSVFTKDAEGDRVISGFAPVPGTGWGVVTQERWTNVIGPINKYNTLLLCLLAAGGLISAGMMFFAMGRILRPIRDLTRGAQRIAGGDFDHTIAARTSGEVQDLAHQFNSMAAALKESYSDLEKKVEARTEELRESQERLRTVISSAPVILFALNREGIFTFSEGRGLDYVGHDPGQSVGRSVFELYSDVPQILEDARRALLGEDFTSIVELNGAAFETRYSPLRAPDGELAGAIGVANDISERRQAEVGLEESELRFRTVAQSANDAIISADSNGNIMFWNTGAHRIFGYTESEVVGWPLTMLIPQRYRDDHQKGLERVRATGETRVVGKTLALHAVRKDGTEFPIELSLAKWETGEGTFFTGMLRDDTERKRAQEALQQYAEELGRSNSDLQQFAYVASHDLQEPLRMVSSYTQLLARRYQGKLDADADEFIGYAVDGAFRMQDLINDLLAYSRIGTNGNPVEMADVNSVFDGVVASLRLTIENNDAAVTRDPLPTVRADASELVQILQNLIVNAIKFHGDEPPRVHVSAQRSGDEWLFSVRDNGIGIEPEYGDRIFGIFQRLHTRDKYPGTGIGLAICKKVVERHAGRIWVESEAGKGSVFYFTLPAGG